MKKSLIFGLMAALALLLSACGTAQPETEQTKAVAILLRQTELELPLEPTEEDELLVVDYDGESALLTVGHPNGAVQGPLSNTDYLLRWHMDGRTERVDVDSEAYVISALCDGEDVLYVDYTLEGDNVRWTLFRAGKGEKTALSGGITGSWEQVPGLFRLGEQVLYLNNGETGASVYQVGAENVTLKHELPNIRASLGSMRTCSNGTEYIFYGWPEGTEQLTLFVCDRTGLRWQVAVDEYITNAAINRDYAVIGLRDEGSTRFANRYIRLSDGTVTTEESSEPLFRLAGSGETFLYVDEDFGAYVTRPGLAQGCGIDLNDTGVGTYQNWPTLFYPDRQGGYLVQLEIEHKLHFWRLES